MAWHTSVIMHGTQAIADFLNAQQYAPSLAVHTYSLRWLVAGGLFESPAFQE